MESSGAGVRGPQVPVRSQKLFIIYPSPHHSPRTATPGAEKKSGMPQSPWLATVKFIFQFAGMQNRKTSIVYQFPVPSATGATRQNRRLRVFNR